MMFCVDSVSIKIVLNIWSLKEAKPMLYHIKENLIFYKSLV